MRARLAALLMAVVALVGIPTIVAPAAANAAIVYCEGTSFAPNKVSNYIVGSGNLNCNDYLNQLTGWRILVVLQDNQGHNIAGTSSGWIYTPSWTYIAHTESNSSSLCLTSGAKTYRTEVQFSATHVQTGYSGIQYAYSSFVSRNCGVAGYS